MFWTREWAIVLLVLASPAGLFANGQEHGSEEHEGGVQLHANALGLVVGGTWEGEERKTFFTLGVEYGREISHRWAASLVAENLSDLDAWVFVAPITFRPGSKHDHPKSHILLSFGPGFEHKSRRHRSVENEHGGGDGQRGSGLETEPATEQAADLFLWRMGLKYAVHVGSRFAIVPAVDLDLVREHGEWVEAVVFDVAFTWGF